MDYLNFLDAPHFNSVPYSLFYFGVKIVPTILLLLLLCKIFLSLFIKKISLVNIKNFGILWFWVISHYLLIGINTYTRFYTYTISVLTIFLEFFYVVGFSSLTFSILLVGLENIKPNTINERKERKYLLYLKNLLLSEKYFIFGTLSTFLFFYFFNIEYLSIERNLDPEEYKNPFACMNCPLPSYEKSFRFLSFNLITIYSSVYMSLRFLKIRSNKKLFVRLYSLVLLIMTLFVFRTFYSISVGL